MLQTLPKVDVTTKSFRGTRGGSEHMICVTAPAASSFENQIAFLRGRYADALRSLGLASDTAVFRRLFLSDAINQAPIIHACGLASESPDNPVATSVVQQPPLPDAKIALLAYHIEQRGQLKKQRISPKHLLIEKNGARHLWSTGLCTGTASRPLPGAQTRGAFKELIETLSPLGATLANHCVRTWIYLKDIDLFYQGMVGSRRELFSRQGLTRHTHYIASTGIEGACCHPFDVVALDAYCNLDLLPAQRSFLNDPDSMCATHDYGVTFERGTQVSYADRSHYFISGTASIDGAGRTLHPGNVLKQLSRALRNVDGLLRAGGANLDDMMHWIVYLRDAADHARVRDWLREALPKAPILIVQGAVCRPEWLVEVEGMAIAANDDQTLPAF